MLSSSVYVNGDIEAALQALAATAVSMSGHSPSDQIELRGYLKALSAVAIMFHVGEPLETRNVLMLSKGLER